ncbi:hypothetical protein, partial [Sulfitobacter sp.]|uniref:hypothetical protein n=1 Tax=Sulfitobacter sp. TaxID=1903071 RepID=UPI0039E3CA80
MKSELHRLKDGILVTAALANLDPKYLPILDRLESEFEKTRRTIENNPMARAQVIAQNMPRFLKWSGKTGQRAKMYPSLKTGYRNDEETQFFRQVQSYCGARSAA